MNTKDFFLALDLIEKEKGIERAVVIEAFEHALVSAYKRNFNEAAEIVVKANVQRIGFFHNSAVGKKPAGKVFEFCRLGAAQYAQETVVQRVLVF